MKNPVIRWIAGFSFCKRLKENENKGNCTVGLYVGLRSWRVKVQRVPYISLIFCFEIPTIYEDIAGNRLNLTILMFLFGSEKEDKWTFINPFLTHELTGEPAFWWKVCVKPTEIEARWNDCRRNWVSLQHEFQKCVKWRNSLTRHIIRRSVLLLACDIRKIAN